MKKHVEIIHKHGRLFTEGGRFSQHVLHVLCEDLESSMSCQPGHKE